MSYGPGLLTLDQAVIRYGPIVDGKWERETEFCGFFDVPPDAAARLMNYVTGSPQKHVYCNKDMGPAMQQAFRNVRDRGLLNELHTYDGCFWIRTKRGEQTLSTHAYALAIDLNAKENPLHGPVSFSRSFIECFTDAGFLAGADFKRVDGMHFQIANW